MEEIEEELKENSSSPKENKLAKEITEEITKRDWQPPTPRGPIYSPSGGALMT